MQLLLNHSCLQQLCVLLKKHLGIMQKMDTCKIVGNMFSNGNVNGTFVEYFYAKELFELQFTTKI